MNTTSVIAQRAPSASDIDERLKIGFSPEIDRMYGAGSDGPKEMTRRQAEAWYRSLADHPNAWVIEVDGRLSGQARLDNFNRSDKRARLAVGLLREEDIGRDIGRTAVRKVLALAFGELGLHRVDLRVLAFNERAIRCYRACGFRKEGVERESCCIGGTWHDDWIMGILSHDFEAPETT